MSTIWEQALADEMARMNFRDNQFLRSLLGTDLTQAYLEYEIATDVNMELDDLTYEQYGEDRSMVDYASPFCLLCTHVRAEMAHGVVRRAIQHFHQKQREIKLKALHASINSDVWMLSQMLLHGESEQATAYLNGALIGLQQMNAMLSEKPKE